MVACEATGKFESIHESTNNDNPGPSHNANEYFDGHEKTRKDGLVAEFRNSGIHFCQGFSYSHENAALEVFVQERESENSAPHDVITQSPEADDSPIPTAKSISGDTGSDTSFKTALGWLEECLKTHRTLCPLIAGPDGPPKLPTRVIDVGTPIRLIQTNKSRGHYACLSHCWGKIQPLRTTIKPNTFEKHLEEIRWEQLPKTFQEAIQVTRNFGIQYLWIDSLCIIQDDPEDWKIEAAQMAEVYQNAVITFAGSASTGHSQGLFRKADHDHVDRSLFDRTPLEGLEKIRKRKPLSHDSNDLPLMHRGWVFQERLLSSRYLHFGQNELLWECMERQICECGGLDFEERSRFTWLAPKNRLHPNSLRIMNSMPWTIPKAWQAAVSDYSRTNLSHPSDILLAVSGIAKNVQKATEWTYVAGLWREHLIINLGWKMEHPENVKRCEKWRAPTFSWASVTPKSEGQSYITYEPMRYLWDGLKEGNTRQRTDIYAEDVDTYCEPDGPDPTGMLKSAYITLSGTLIKATLRHLPKKKAWDITLVQGELLEPSFFYNDFDFDSENSKTRDGDTVFCLKLIGSSSIPNRNGEYLLYLVLKKVGSDAGKSDESVTEHIYERIGLLRDARGEDAVCLEEGSHEDDVQRDIVVKIV